MEVTVQQRSERVVKGWHVVVGLLVLSVLLVVVIVFGSLAAGPPVRGGVQLSTYVDEPEVDFHVGDRLVGTSRGEMFVTWDEILGWNGQEPLGIVLPHTAPPVPGAGAIESLSKVHAELLAGPGATVVFVEANSWSGLGESEFARMEILLRRADGSLDQVFCLNAQLVGHFGQTYRLLIPVRVRSRGQPSSGYFTGYGSGGLGFAGGVFQEWQFESTEPPQELVAEIENNGLWTPRK